MDKSLELCIFFLFGAGTITGCIAIIARLGRLQAEEYLKKNIFFRWLFAKQHWEGFLSALHFTKYLLQLFFVATAFFAFAELSWVTALLLIIAISLFIDIIFTLLVLLKKQAFFPILAPLVAFYLLLCLPLSFSFYRLRKWLTPLPTRDKSVRLRHKILDFLQDSDLSNYLDPQDQKLILSVASFKERIAREVMVPRIDVFCLPADTTLHEAALSFLNEGYSRIPVWRESVDNIIGVLLYKDVLNIYARSSQEKPSKDPLNSPIETIVKPVLYTPETKKISHLLQEFRGKQIHLAIVVDEYGGTEGIVTIEDILEELVGEIADEYDVGEKELFTPLPGGGWIVDAKMGILDIEEELGIKIPPSPEYDTIGGYIFHRAGAIPPTGWRIHHDEFDLEILSSDERSIDKIRITPH